jgi:hypothetical protein
METDNDHHGGSADLVSELGKRALPESVVADFSAVWQRGLQPYDVRRRAELADELVTRHLATFPPASLERAHFLLQVLQSFYPTGQVSNAYLDNLQGLLGDREPLDKPGTVVLGVGTGRCGSTSLAAAFREADAALATHETPPMIFWQPQPEQVEFHMRRLALLSRYYRLVFDAAHWWLKLLPGFLERFPGGRVIGLHRDMESCVNSFLRIKGVEPGSVNHWAPPDDTRWRKSSWDPCYPSFVAPQEFDGDPFMAKGTQIQWYVDSYNAELQELARRYPGRFLLIHTDTLDEPQVSQNLSAFAGTRVSIPDARYNASAMDSVDQQKAFWF